MERRVYRRNDLSAKSKGIYAFLLTQRRPIGKKDLAIFFKDGRDSLSSGLKELIDKDLAKIVYTRNEKGKFTGSHIELITKGGVNEEGDSRYHKL